MLSNPFRYSKPLMQTTLRMIGHTVPDQNLESLGLNKSTIIRNPTVSELYEYALSPELKSSVDPRVRDTAISSTGALVSYSGEKTGRSPKDKKTVLDQHTKSKVWWGDVNMPISRDSYKLVRQRAIDYLNTRSHIFVVDGWGGWDPLYKVKVRVICNRPYHALFMQTMLMRPTPEQIEEDFNEGADLTIINGGEYAADPQIEGVGSKTCIGVDYTNGEIAILGSHYAGEMKKGLFGVMHYLMPQ